jgi:hypothetical protein
VFTTQLSNAPRTQVVIEFTFGTESSVNNPGWFIDNVQIGNPNGFPPVAPVFTSTPPTVANQNTAYTYTVAGTGTPPPTFTATILPSWLTFNATTRVLSGTPTGATAVGAYQVQITATSGAQTPVTQTFTINLFSPQQAPAITSTPPSDASDGHLYTYNIAATGSPPPTLSVAATKPAWLALDTTARTLSGTPTVFDLGTAGPFTLTAANGVGTNATQSITINVVSSVTVGQPITNTPMIIDFETGLPAGWAANGDWQFGDPTPDIPTGAFDQFCAGTVVPGLYTNNRYSLLQTPVVDLTNVQSPTARFTHYYKTNGNLDAGNVLISTNAGQTFTVVPSAAMTMAYNGAIGANGQPDAAQQGWFGTIAPNDWAMVDINLNTAIGAAPRNLVVIRFAFGTNTTTNDVGWYIDRFRLGDPAQFPPEPPRFTSVAPLTAQEGRAFSYTAVAVGPPTPTYALVNNPPSWLSINPTTGVLSGTPGIGNVGSSTVTIRASTGSPVTADQTFTLTVLSASVQPVLSEGFEGTTFSGGVASTITFPTSGNTWKTSFANMPGGLNPATRTDWEIGVPAIQSFSAPVKPVPTGAFAGTNVAGTILNGRYQALETLSRLDTPVVNLTGTIEPVVKFQHWYEAEPGFDGGHMMISFNGNAATPTFEAVATTNVSDPYTDPSVDALGNIPGWSSGGTTTNWTPVTVDIKKQAAGRALNQVIIRFEFGADDIVQHSGWYIDAVNIGERITLP